MLVYKIDVLEELKKAGITQTKVRNTGIFSQSTMKKFKDNNTNISLDSLNTLCCVLEMQPRDIIKYVETGNDNVNILNKLVDKHEN